MRKCSLFAAAAGLLLPGLARAAVIAVPVTGFNQDVVVDTGAPQGANVQSFTTATMDDGTGNTGGTWYQLGYLTAALTSGLPSGLTVPSATGDGTFTLQPANGSNALLLNDRSPTGTLAFVASLGYGQLAIFDSTGNGSGAISYTINHVGGATETGTFTSSDWFGGTPVAFNASGRINNVVTGATDSVGSANPNVYEHTITVNNPAPVQSISFTRATGGGNTAIFAVSGTAVPEPGSFALVALGGFGLLARRRA